MERDAMMCSDVRDDSDNLHSKLSKAIVSTDEQTLELLLKSGADVTVQDESGNTSLHAAAKLGQPHLCQLLIQNGGEVNSTNHAGITPVFLASRANPQTVQVLIQHGADGACRNHLGEQFPLHAASSSSSGSVDVIVELLTSGSDVNFASWPGLTPLCVAVNSGGTNAVQTLLRFGLDSNQVLLAPKTVSGEDGGSGAGSKEGEQAAEERHHVRVCVPGEEGDQCGHGTQELAGRCLGHQGTRQSTGVHLGTHPGGGGHRGLHLRLPHHLGPVVQPADRHGPSSHPSPLSPPPAHHPLVPPPNHLRYHLHFRLGDLSAAGPRPRSPVSAQQESGHQRGLDCATAVSSSCPPQALSSSACVCAPVLSSSCSPYSEVLADTCCSPENRPGKLQLINTTLFRSDAEPSQLESNTKPSLSPNPPFSPKSDSNSELFSEESAQCHTVCTTDDNMEPTLPDLMLGDRKSYKLCEATFDESSPECETVGPNHCVEEMELDTSPLGSSNSIFSNHAGQSISENNADIHEELHGYELLSISYSDNPATVEEDSEEVQKRDRTSLDYVSDSPTPMEITDSTGMFESSDTDGANQSDPQHTSFDTETTLLNNFAETDTTSSSLPGDTGKNSFLDNQSTSSSHFTTLGAHSPPHKSTEKEEGNSHDFHKFSEKNFRGVTFRRVTEDAHELFMDTEPISAVASSGTFENTEKASVALVAGTDGAKNPENSMASEETSIPKLETICPGHYAKEMEQDEVPQMCSNSSVSNKDAVISTHQNTDISTVLFAADSGVSTDIEKTTTKSSPLLEAENIVPQVFEKPIPSATKSSLLFVTDERVPQDLEKTTASAAKPNPVSEAENVETQDFEKPTPSAAISSAIFVTDNRVSQDLRNAIAWGTKSNPVFAEKTTISTDLRNTTPSAAESTTPENLVRPSDGSNPGRSQHKGLTEHHCAMSAGKSMTSEDLVSPSDGPNPGPSQQKGYTAHHFATSAAKSSLPADHVRPSDGPNPCHSQQRGITTRHYATSAAKSTTPEDLVRPSDDPNPGPSQQKGFTALHRAAQLGMETACQTLLELGARVNARSTRDETPLHLAAKFASTGGRGDTGGLVRLLIRSGADVDAVTSSGETALHLAALVGDALFASVLISEGADVRRTDAAGNTPLHKACQRMVSPEAQRVRTVRVLLSSGAKPDEVNRHGLTPLHVLLLHRDDNIDLDVVRVLVSYGADPNRLTAAGEHPLTLAVRCGLFSFAGVLVEKGSNPNVVSEEDGKTPMHYACKAAQVPLFKLLWAKGGDPTQLDARGFSPLRYAVESGSEAMVRACLDTGASTFQRFDSDLPKLHVESKAVPSLSEVLESSSDLPSPFLCAFSQAHSHILAMLFASGCYSVAELHHLRSICEPVNRDELPERQKDAVLCLLDISQSPSSLQNLCRFKISHMIGCSFDRKLRVCSLGLPTMLRSFVLFADDARSV